MSSRQTQMPRTHFFDEDGAEHSHDPNAAITRYRCSNGHRFEERSCWQCATCGWKAFEAKITQLGSRAAESTT